MSEQKEEKKAIEKIDLIKWFSELNNTNVPIAGGKGASLGEMFNNKFPVPPGFVITAQSFGTFMAQSGLDEKVNNIIKSVDLEDTGELRKASDEIRALIENKKCMKT